MIERDGLKGVTSNPLDLSEAIGESDEYTSSIKDFLANGDRSICDIYEHLAMADIRAAADVLKPVYDQTPRPRRLCEPGMLPPISPTIPRRR